MGAHSKRKAEPRILRLLEGPWLFVVVAVAILLVALGVGSYLIYDTLWPGPVTAPLVPNKG
jgi:hypothetical protein